MEEIIGQVEITGPVLTEKLSENEVIKKATKTGKRKVKDTDEAGSGKKIASRGKHLKTRESSQGEIENFRRGEGKVRDKKNRPKEQDVMKKMKQRQNKTIQSATSPSLKDLTNGAEDTEQETQSSEEQERESEMGGARLDDPDSPGHNNEREDEDTDQYVSWVQCSVAECGKWRKLSEDVDPSGLPEKWTCQQNTDPDFNSCRVPEEKCIPSEEIFSDLVPGSLVWARQIGYPWWPAIVERDPDTDGYLEFRKKSDTIPYKYHVTFLGDAATRAWVHRSRVKNFTDLSVDQLSKEVEKSDAILMANEALSLSLKERLVQFGFSSRYVSDIESSQEDSDIADILQLFCERTDSGSSDEDKKKKIPNLAEGKEKCGTRKRANKKMSSKTKRNEKKKGRREEEERDRATPSCSTATPPEKRARKPAKIRQKSKAKQQSETGPLESDRKDEDDLKSLDLKEPGDRESDEQEKLFISLLEE